MLCHYISDLHLETQEFHHRLKGGDVLIIAGDLCNASALGPSRTDLFAQRQRDRVLRLLDEANKLYAQVILVPGNHEHHDGVFEQTVALLREHLIGVLILDDEAVEIDGVTFFGTTLWSDCEGRNDHAIDKIRRGVGEYFFTKTKCRNDNGLPSLRKLRPSDTIAAHDRALIALTRLADTAAGPMVVISHHAPSYLGLNMKHTSNGLDGAFASKLDHLVERFANVKFWIHGHTHMRARYQIGSTTLLTNCLGFSKDGLGSGKFDSGAHFHVQA